MAPIRVGIVGLSSKPGAWATLAHLPRLAKSPNYEIVALCNSSIESTRAAIQAHGLPENTRAYDSYAGLAADPDVDLYVVSTRADSHLDVALPALQAGKNVFVEWPLASTTEDAQRMADLAREKGVRAMVGFQARASPSILKIKSLIESGALGEVHSVNYQGVVNNWIDGTADARYAHFMDRKAGANVLTIYGGHVMDAIFYCLGELEPGSYRAQAVNLRPEMPVKGTDGSILADTRSKDTPDQILLQGTLDRQPPAVLSLHLRAGARFVDVPGSTWRVFGTKAELVVDFTSAGPQMARALNMRICYFETGRVETLFPEEGGPEWEDLPKQGQNIGRLYEAYASGGPYADFEVGVRRHRLLDEFWASMK